MGDIVFEVTVRHTTTLLPVGGAVACFDVIGPMQFTA